MQKTFYDVLEVSPNASPEVIRVAYEQLLKRYADVEPNADALEHMAAINLAYEVLSDPAKRRAYGFAAAERVPAQTNIEIPRDVMNPIRTTVAPSITSGGSPSSESDAAKWLAGAVILLVAGLGVYFYSGHAKEQAAAAQQKAADESFRQGEEKRMYEVYGLQQASQMVTGQGMPQDFAGAFAYFKKIADTMPSDSSDYARSNAASQAGVMALEGKGREKSSVEAAKWFLKAAILGHSDARASDNFPSLKLAQMYEAGNGVPKDLQYAYAWYNIAASQQEVFGGEFILPGFGARGIEAGKKRDKIGATFSASQLEAAQKLWSKNAFWGRATRPGEN